MYATSRFLYATSRFPTRFQLTNAQAEIDAIKPAFRAAFQGWRRLILADGFFDRKVRCTGPFPVSTGIPLDPVLQARY
jgi:putative SOS response-associated peptidase YedK